MENLTGGDTVAMGADLVRVGWVVLGAVGVIMFGAIIWLYRDRLRDARALLALVTLVLTLPVVGKLIVERTNLMTQADTEVKIVSTQSQRQNGSLVVYLTLSEPAYVYMEYKDEASGKTQTVVSGGDIEKRIGQTFEITNAGSAGGQAVFVINGKKSEPVVVK